MPEATVQLNQNTVGFEARPDTVDPQPGVIIVHEVTGLNDYIKEVANTFAKQNFVALAVDLYEGKTAQGMEDGAPLREKVTGAVFREKIGAGIEYLKTRPYCTGDLGVTGFCMGGGFALWAACLFPDDLRACSMFYGRIGDLGLLQNLQHPVIGNFGAEDTGISTWAGQQFWPEMMKLGKSLDMKLYPGAPHGFARHTDPRAYRAEAANDAFARTFDLFNRTLRVAHATARR
ncbi:MAG TPA: dienelactone hydrolase family protein [Chloroflexota bacterium]|nr:dienelactone hydrolase family protein [Chloroflexota bacterium]